MSSKFNNIIKLIKQNATKRPNKGEKSLLCRGDIDLLLQLTKNDGKQSYLHRLQKRCLIQQLKLSILKERVLEALNNLNDMVTPSSNETPLDKQARLEELLSQIAQSSQITTESDNKKFNKASEAFVITDVKHNYATKVLKTRINRNPEIEKNAKNTRNFKNTENNAKRTILQPQVDIVFKGIPSMEQEIKILQAISQKLADAYSIAKTTLFDKYRTVKIEYYVTCEHTIDLLTKAIVLNIANMLSYSQTFVLQYLSMDEIKSAGTFYILRPSKGDYEKANYLKLRLNPELLANLIKIPTADKVDIHIFESELLREEMELKGNKTDNAMKELLYSLVKSWTDNPTLYDSRIQCMSDGNRPSNLTILNKPQSPKSRRKCLMSPVKKCQSGGDIRHLEQIDVGMKVKTILVPAVQVALFVVFVCSFVTVEYVCL